MFECETERLVLKVLDKRMLSSCLIITSETGIFKGWEPERNENFTLTLWKGFLSAS